LSFAKMTPRVTATAISKARNGIASFQNRRGGELEVGVELAAASASVVVASTASAVVAGGIVSASLALALELVLAVGTGKGTSTILSGLSMMYNDLVVSAFVSEGGDDTDSSSLSSDLK
jgi:hypothetical protein